MLIFEKLTSQSEYEDFTAMCEMLHSLYSLYETEIASGLSSESQANESIGLDPTVVYALVCVYNYITQLTGENSAEEMRDIRILTSASIFSVLDHIKDMLLKREYAAICMRRKYLCLIISGLFLLADINGLREWVNVEEEEEGAFVNFLKRVPVSWTNEYKTESKDNGVILYLAPAMHYSRLVH